MTADQGLPGRGNVRAFKMRAIPRADLHRPAHRTTAQALSPARLRHAWPRVRAFDPEFLIDEGVIDPEDRDLFWFADSAEDAWRDILHWYEAAAHPLLPPAEGDPWEATEVRKEIES